MILVDPPNSPGHGRLWSHLASDTSFEELHAFALALGVPQRGFDRDHYDVPEEWYDTVIAAGAVPVSSRELLERLRASGLRRPKPHTLAPRRPGRRLLRPPRLRPGDVVAVVAPAGPVRAERVEAGAARLEEWGLRVRFADAAPHPTLSWLSARDEDRAEHLQWALTDPGVAAVWAARGGFGTQRVLDLLDWDVVSDAAPRLLVGFSDLTALHQAAAARLGLATLHAPGVGGLADGEPATLERVRDLVFGHASQVLHGRPDPRFAHEGGVESGVVEGVTVGGNLTVLATSVGTGHLRPAADQIAVLEDVGEQPYRLDRSLTQLLRSGWFDGVRGVALGRFTDCGDPAHVDALLAERLAPLGVPVLAGLLFGHNDENHPVPLGVRARLDPAAGTLEIEAPVR